jgi:DNA-binding CsgD family transcriptional regulator
MVGGFAMNKAVAICAFKKFDLTSRESDVLLCITRGSSNAEIGINLGISPRTVKKHLEHIYGKLGVKSRLGAAAKASAASLGFARANAKRTESGADALYEI